MINFSGRFLGQDIFSHETWEWIFQAGILQKAGKVGEVPAGTRIFSVGPALCDPQINGGLGYSFGNPGTDPAPLLGLVRHLQGLGIAWFLPTLITDKISGLIDAFEKLERIRNLHPELDQACPGYHLEGPWISPEDGYRGAHPRDCVCHPEIGDFDLLQSAAGGKIVLVTLAPEVNGALSMIADLRKRGVRVAIGHTQADAETVEKAVIMGATLSTHLGNGIASTIGRHANPLWPQLAHPGLTASYIPDGHHIPRDFIRCLLRCKGKDAAIITADSSPVAGLPPGTYTLWNTTVEISPDGRVGLPGSPLLAGSGCFTDHCIRHLIRSGEATTREALTMASINTGKALSLTIPWDPAGGTFVLFQTTTENPWLPQLVSIQGKIQGPANAVWKPLDQSD